MGVEYCENWRSCRSKFEPASIECLECFAITTLERQGRGEEADKASEAWLKRCSEGFKYE